MNGVRKRPVTFIEQARRRQIVDTTIATLAAEGYRAATFGRIAERAGISPSLISYHFSTKSALMAQVVDDIIADMDAAITAEIGETPSPRAALRRLIESQVRYFAGHTAAVLALGHIGSSGEEAITRRLSEHRTTALAEMEQLFAEGQHAGEMAGFATRPMAVTLMAALEAVPGEFFAAPDCDTTAYGLALADLFDAAVAPR